MRPDSRYGVSKAFSEALASLYSDKHGLGFLCIRIGNVNEEPLDERRLAIWLKPETRIEALKLGGRETLVTTAAPLAFVAASDVAPVVAFLTQSGELGVYSCAAKAVVLHATGGPE